MVALTLALGIGAAIALSPEGASLAIAIEGGVLLWQAGASREPLRFAVQGEIAQRRLSVGPSGTTVVAVASEGVTRAGETLVTYLWQPPNATPVARNAVGTGHCWNPAT